MHDIRQLLKSMNLQEFYGNATSIVSMATAWEIPYISDDQRLYIDCAFVTIVYPQLRDKSICYQFYIHKILDHMLKGEQRQILRYIYLQSADVQCKNELNWDKISEFIAFDKFIEFENKMIAHIS